MAMAMAMAALAVRSPSLPKHTVRSPQGLANSGFKKSFMSQTRWLSTPAKAAAMAKVDGVSKEFHAEPATAMGAALLAAISLCDSAAAAQQVMEIAAEDNRGTLLLLPLVPALAWVLYNILTPALNQLNRMRNEKGVVVWLGLGAGTGAAVLSCPEGANAEQEMFTMAEAAANNDSRGLLLLIVIAPAILWVLYNILQPALNQINRMRSG